MILFNRGINSKNRTFPTMIEILITSFHSNQRYAQTQIGLGIYFFLNTKKVNLHGFRVESLKYILCLQNMI